MRFARTVCAEAIINACCRNAEEAGDALGVFRDKISRPGMDRCTEAAIRSGSGSWRVSILGERERRLPGGRVRLINEIRRAGAVASWDSQLKLRPDP